MKFKALQVIERSGGKFERIIAERHIDELPQGDILIRVNYSALNYKDALSASGNKGITKKFPHTPGIDAAGIVEISRNAAIACGDEVLVTGYDLGMNTDGGFGQFIRVPANWVIPKPDGYTLRECMILGTAGFTAATALHKMERLGLTPAQGPVVVTGATGGVGSLAVAILHKAGYEVIAISGKENAAQFLKPLGAAQVEKRAFVLDNSGKALLKPRWAGAIDTVGGTTLQTLLKACQLEGVVASTGLVGSPLFEGTVYPFILNGVSLVGVGSAEMSHKAKLEIWQALSGKWNIQQKLAIIAREVDLESVNNTYIDQILQGKTMGRILVNLNVTAAVV